MPGFDLAIGIVKPEANLLVATNAKISVNFIIPFGRNNFIYKWPT
jgi:hypothetical protein